MGRNFLRRGEWYYYNRRVPKELAPYDPRSHVRISLKTKDEGEARKRAEIYDDFIEKYWADLIKAGVQDRDLGRFRQVRMIAKAHGFAYKNIAEVVDSALLEVLSRVEYAAAAPTDRTKTEALLGARELSGMSCPPSASLADCPDLFWPLCADRLTEKSEHQIRKYKTPRKAAMNNFVAVVGNLSLTDVRREHVLKFRNWLMGRVESGEITGNTANKQLGHVKDILHTVTLEAEIDIEMKPLFAETKLRYSKRSRPPFTATFVQETFLDRPSLGGLNEQARMLVYLMIETGARESEIIGLTPDDFFLDQEVPHIWIRKNEIRDIKTASSQRKIPLVGVALIAARAISPTGLTRYQEKPDHASGAINKFLRENDLKPTPKHTLYSLRHTFKDRLRDAEAPEEIIDELMGHRKPGPHYGRGRTLEAKHQWLQRIALRPPVRL